MSYGVLYLGKVVAACPELFSMDAAWRWIAARAKFNYNPPENYKIVPRSVFMAYYNALPSSKTVDLWYPDDWVNESNHNEWGEVAP